VMQHYRNLDCICTPHGKANSSYESVLLYNGTDFCFGKGKKLHGYIV